MLTTIFNYRSIEFINDIPYRNKCKLCDSPARKHLEELLCSNRKCKSWRSVSRVLNTYQKFEIKPSNGQSKENPILVICPICFGINSELGASQRRIASKNEGYCRDCSHIDSYFHIELVENFYYKTARYIAKFVGNNNWTEVEYLL